MFRIYSDEEDVKAVASVLNRGTFWASGPEVERFEGAISEYAGTRYALCFNSGTSALHAALLAHEVEGGEVVVPSFTFVSTVNSVVLAGGKPVFAESEPETLGLDASDVVDRLTPKTKAIVAIHYAGFPSKDVEALRDLARDRGLLLVEDAAEAFGARLNGQMVGTFGDSAMYSFCQNKIITTGEGGALVTDSEEVFERAKLVRSHGRLEEGQDYFSSVRDNDYVRLGYNYRLSTPAAALGLAQLSKVDKIISMRRDLAGRLEREISKCGDVEFPKEPTGGFSVHQFFPLFLGDQSTRDQFQSFLSDRGIMTKVYFQPVHLKKYYREQFGCAPGDLPTTESLSARAVSLPFFPHMEDGEVNYLLEAVREFFNS
ncbi:MAG: DegT/DnrJ/EryC1/StrS family aminotransferase [Promethearchaeota archaeon]